MTIDESLVSKLISQQFPEYSALKIKQILPGGWDNRSFHLGKDKLVRLPSSELYKDQVNKEQRWLPVLSAQLEMEIPKPLAKGKPCEAYPWPWSIYQWIEGQTAKSIIQLDQTQFAKDLAVFLTSLQAIDTEGGPVGGEHNFYRGCSLAIYNHQTLEALGKLKNEIDTNTAKFIWNAALATQWSKPSVWIHGDISPDNLLVTNGLLSAVIDFGCLAIGDPACDLAIAWTFFNKQNRAIFKKQLSVDEGTWQRGAVWALWKALIIEAGLTNAISSEKAIARRTIEAILQELGG